MTTRLLLGLVLVGVVEVGAAHAQSTPQPTPPSAANPDDEIAKGLFQAGKAAFDAGRYQEAYDRFFEAYEHSQRSALLFNLAIALDRLRRDGEALAHYRGYLEEVPDAENRAEVENRIKALEAATSKTRALSATAVPPATTTAGGPETGLVLLPDVERAEEPRDRGTPLLEQWWLWTAVGVVAVAVVAGVVVASGGDEVGKPLPGSEGMVVIALETP